MTEVCKGGTELGFMALDYGRVAFLGVVQGVTELLPVSSTAHMRIVPAMLGWQDPGAAFSAVMQLAALIGIVSYFWRDIADLTGGTLSALARRDYGDEDFRLAVWIVLGTLPIVIAGIVLAPVLNACGSPLRSIPAIGLACLAMAGLLALAEVRAAHSREITSVSLKDVLFVGLAQAFALVPGVSRSGSSLTASFACGFKREEAAKFSFLLGIPAIAAAGSKELWELHKLNLNAHAWSVLAVGLSVGAMSSLFAVWGLMRFLERFSTWLFVGYRLALGVFLLVSAGLGAFN